MQTSIEISKQGPIKNQVVFSYNNTTELVEILGLTEYCEYQAKFGEADNQSNFEDE